MLQSCPHKSGAVHLSSSVPASHRPHDVPTSPGGIRTLWASWVRSAAPVHGGAQRKVSTFPVHQEMAVFSLRCHVSEKPPPVPRSALEEA